MAKLDQLFAAYPSSVRIQGTTEADVTCVNSEYNQELITLFIRKYSLGSTYFAHKLPQLEKSYLNIRKIQNESYALQQTLIGRELVKVGQLNEAFEKYQSALELDSDCIAAIISRGELFLMKNKAAKALADFSKALEMDPLNKEAKKHLSIAMESVKAEGARQQSLKSGEFLLPSTYIPKNKYRLSQPDQSSDENKGKKYEMVYSDDESKNKKRRKAENK